MSTVTESAPSQRRSGEIIDRQPHGSGFRGRMGTYFVQDGETGEHFGFDYSDIVTEGFRTIRVGERVRFFTSTADAERASFVIRLDQPDVEDFYQ